MAGLVVEAVEFAAAERASCLFVQLFLRLLFPI